MFSSWLIPNARARWIIYPSNKMQISIKALYDSFALLQSKMVDSKYRKILFICRGNTCRSPCAKAILRYLLQEREDRNEWEIDSAGTLGYPEDNLIHNGNWIKWNAIWSEIIRMSRMNQRVSLFRVTSQVYVNNMHMISSFYTLLLFSFHFFSFFHSKVWQVNRFGDLSVKLIHFWISMDIFRNLCLVIFPLYTSECNERFFTIVFNSLK